jgi:peptidoglycan/xylan/chitin deacetylase (PgdA/CDA1 family)
MGIVRKIVRNVLFPMLNQLGINKHLINMNSDKFLIVAYHGVVPQPDLNINYRHISLEEFKQHLQFYHEYFEVLSMKQIQNKEFKTNRPKLVITFDDAYKNVFKYAMPLLEQYQFYSSVYVVSNSLVSTGYLLWPDYIDILKLKGVKSLCFDDDIFGLTERGYEMEGLHIYDYFKAKGSERLKYVALLKDTIIEKFGAEIFENEYFRLINKAELIDYKERFPMVVWGSHTTDHYNLSNIDAALVGFELNHSKLVLEEILGIEVEEIAYPDGSYNAEVYEAGKIIPFKWR